MSHSSLGEAPLSVAILTERANAIGRFPSNPPLHNAICFMDDQQELEQFIRDFHLLDPPSLNRKDDHGFTPIYLAAFSSNLAVVRTLLELKIDMADLRTRETADRVTPLMTLQDNLRTTRSFCSGKTIHFGRNPSKASLADEVEIERLLKDAIGNYGMSTCTCNLCDDGWLSEKMRAQLHITAQRILAEMLEKIQCSRFYDTQDPYLAFLPLEVREKMSTRLYKGYRSYMVIIADILADHQRRKIPDFLTICSLLPPGPSIIDTMMCSKRMSDEWFYRDNGGHIDNVLECLIEIAAQEVNGRDTIWLERTARMRSCDNDVNFNLVRRRLGMWGDLS